MAKIRLCCITCKRSDMGYEEQVEKACKGGADAILFKDKTLSAREIIDIGTRIKDVCKDNNVQFFINDRPDLALVIDADGVELGNDDIPLPWARQIIGGRKTIGCSVDSLGRALSATKEGAGYLVVGPLFGSASKPSKEERGVDIIRIIKDRVRIPVLASGGINTGNVSETIKAGAEGIAVMRSVCGSRDISQSANELKQLILRALEDREHTI